MLLDVDFYDDPENFYLRPDINNLYAWFVENGENETVERVKRFETVLDDVRQRLKGDE